MRAVLDVNVLVSGAAKGTGSPRRLLEAWLEGHFELIVSAQLIDELTRVLAYPKVRRLVNPSQAERLLALLERVELTDDPADPPPVVPPDPDDVYLVALAASAHAILVTGDRGVISLREQIPVMTPPEFLELLGY